MKNIFLIVLLFTGIVKGQIVTIPDANFKAKLLQADVTNQIAAASSGIYVKIDSNNDGEIELNEVQNITRLHVQNSNISSLVGIEFFVNLRLLDCSNNIFSLLDVSALSLLNTLLADSNPNLIFLILKNGLINCSLPPDPPQPPGLGGANFNNCLNLQYVCIDETNLVNGQLYLNAYYSSSNVTLNTYCSFTPGGDYNTITGTTLYDSFGNGCDSNDLTNPYLKVNINDGTNSGATFTNNNGNYTFYTQTGDFTLTPQIENSSYFNFTPASSILNFPIVDNSTQTQNFCMTANGVHPDLEVTLVPLTPLRPGVNVRYKIVYKNKGTQVLSGNVKLSHESNFFDFIATFPNDNFTINSNEFSWNYTLLQPFETRTIELTLYASLALSLGNLLNFTAIVNPIVTDEIPSDNTFVLHQTVVNSYDPNSISCLEGNMITTEEVGGYLHYNINFENIGTAEALNIVVKDTINIAKFDVNSLQLQYASHNVETKITGNILELIFKNINLPSVILNPIGGHGNVLFKIKTIPTLVVGDNVESSANIYFDYNEPIATNEAITSITALNNPDFVRDKTIVIAPNPTKNNVTVSSKTNIQSIQLFDVQGRLLQTVLENKNTTTIDISNKSDGIYFLKVTTEMGSSVEKLVKEN